MQEENINEQESLDIIQSMINRARNQFSENGFIYLLWGWVILVCSLSQFILERLHYSRHYLVWMLTWLALIVQVIYYAKRSKLRLVKTYTDDIIAYVWLAFVIMLLLTGTLTTSVLRPDQYYIGSISILILYGMPTFLSGIILKFRALVMGGAGCWVLAIAARFIPHEFIILMISMAVIVAWIIPGYLLRKRYNKENQ